MPQLPAADEFIVISNSNSEKEGESDTRRGNGIEALELVVVEQQSAATEEAGEMGEGEVRDESSDILVIKSF